MICSHEECIDLQHYLCQIRLDDCLMSPFLSPTDTLWGEVKGQEIKIGEDGGLQDKSNNSYSSTLFSCVQSHCFNRKHSVLQPSRSSMAVSGCIFMCCWSAACVTMCLQCSREGLSMKAWGLMRDCSTFSTSSSGKNSDGHRNYLCQGSIWILMWRREMEVILSWIYFGLFQW